MTFRELMKHNQAAILGDWLARVAETYPAETAKFLLAQKDPFANPVGGAVAEGLAAVLAALAGEPPAGRRRAFWNRSSASGPSRISAPRPPWPSSPG